MGFKHKAYTKDRAQKAAKTKDGVYQAGKGLYEKTPASIKGSKGDGNVKLKPTGKHDG